LSQPQNYKSKSSGLKIFLIFLFSVTSHSMATPYGTKQVIEILRNEQQTISVLDTI